eukprot:4157019-Karenia_brevis.AAC.1
MTCVDKSYAAPSNVKRDNVVELNKRSNLKSNECYFEHIGDSGAGKMIWSERALEEQGIPKHLWSSCLGPASVP